MSRSLGVVVPAYRPNVERLREYVHALDSQLDIDELHVELDDPQFDVNTAFSDVPATVNVSHARRGKGAAITCGFEQLDADVLVFADGDGSTPPASLGDVVEPVLGGAAEFSVGSRRHPDASVASHQTYGRRWLGNGFAWLGRRLLDAQLYDYQCGAKAISRESWVRVREHLYEPGFAWDVELVAMAGALGVKTVEVPITWHDQPDSTVAPVDTSIELARGLLLSRHRAKLLQNSPMHSVLASYRGESSALVERNTVSNADD